MPRDKGLLTQIAEALDQLGPALVPTGHIALLTSITETARTIFGAAACSLALVDDAGENLIFHVASGKGAGDVVGMKVPMGKGIAGWVAMSGQPIAISDLAKDSRFESKVAADTGYVPTSIVAMPLETERGTLGIIEVLDATSHGRDTSRDMEVLARFADQAALAIENSRVFNELGTTVLAAAAAATEGDLSTALMEAAEGASGPAAALNRLAAQLNELSAMGPREIETAAAILETFVTYAKGLKKR